MCIFWIAEKGLWKWGFERGSVVFRFYVLFVSVKHTIVTYKVFILIHLNSIEIEYLHRVNKCFRVLFSLFMESVLKLQRKKTI